MTTEPIDLDALRALEAGATPGPWVHGRSLPGHVTASKARRTREPAVAGPRDAAFIAAARNALPGLLDEVEALRATVGRVRRYRDAVSGLAALLAERGDPSELTAVADDLTAALDGPR